jgi:DNA-binding transcriptional ArsR family regulator
MTDLLRISKALSNPVRIKIMDYLNEKRIANKSDLLAKTGLERAALDHHLKPMVDAGLVGILEITIDKVRNSFCYPKSSISLDVNDELSSDSIRAVLGEAIERDEDHQAIEERAQDAIKKNEINREDAKAILRTLFEHRGRGTKNTCSSCGRIKKMTELALCDHCLKPACDKCRRKIQIREGGTEMICDRCMREMFGS